MENTETRPLLSFSLSLSLYIYIYMCVYMCTYIFFFSYDYTIYEMLDRIERTINLTLLLHFPTQLFATLPSH